MGLKHLMSLGDVLGRILATASFLQRLAFRVQDGPGFRFELSFACWNGVGLRGSATDSNP